jgi:hypothetical protein
MPSDTPTTEAGRRLVNEAVSAVARSHRSIYKPWMPFARCVACATETRWPCDAERLRSAVLALLQAETPDASDSGEGRPAAYESPDIFTAIGLLHPEYGHEADPTSACSVCRNLKPGTPTMSGHDGLRKALERAVASCHASMMPPSALRSTEAVVVHMREVLEGILSADSPVEAERLDVGDKRRERALLYALTAAQDADCGDPTLHPDTLLAALRRDGFDVTPLPADDLEASHAE